MKPYILGATFARGGSKGIARKNIKELAGKPLIAYAIETALSIAMIDRFIVSTEDEEIAEVARSYGADVPFRRPNELATDDSSVLHAWRHAVETIEQQTGQKVDILLTIPATSPLRETQDVEKCLLKLLETDADAVITVTDADRNPYFNMVEFDAEENAKIVNKLADSIVNRQEAPKVYDITTVAYAVRTSYLRKAQSLMGGKVKAVIIPKERALDIDTPLDFEIAELLLEKRNENN